MNQTDVIEVSPVAVLTVIGLYSIVQVSTSHYVFGSKQFIGLTLLGVSLVLFFTERRVYRYLFGTTLLLSLFNLVGFTTAIWTIDVLFIPIQIIAIPFVLVFTLIYTERIQAFLGTSEDHVESEATSKKAGFIRRFERLSDEEIEAKLAEGLVPEALQALQEIKDLRSQEKEG